VTEPLPALVALQESVRQLREFVTGLSAADVRRPAYPTEWTVAQVLSHLGSAAQIANIRVDVALAGEGEVVPQPIWDEWNAKDAESMAADALLADQAFLDRLGSLSDEERAELVIPLGPLQIDYPTHVAFRLNEHTVHRWDIEVVFDPSSGLAAGGVPGLLDFLPTIAGFTGKPSGAAKAITVRTRAPARGFSVNLGGERVVLGTDDALDAADLELPAEAFARLVYGRLDPGHTPPFSGAEADLDQLRRAFPGV